MRYFPYIFSWAFFFLIFFHSSLFFQDIFRIHWNFEFTKVLFFNIIFWGILSVYFLKRKIRTNWYFLWLLAIITISVVFSPVAYISFFWDNDKWHWLMMFTILLFLSSIFFHLENPQFKKIIKLLLITTIPVTLIAIKEYYLPSHDYGELSTRAIGTFWHPSYLSLFLLMLLPFLYDKVFNHKKYWYFAIIFLCVYTLFITHHIFSYIIFIIFNLYFFYSKKIKWLYIGSSFIIILSGLYIIISYFPEKIHSFLSRMYIWQTVLDIIFQSPKTILLWNGPETLDYFFSSSKSPYLYIYENFWYTADRAHNIYLDFWYQFWIGWLIPLIIGTFYLIKNFEKNSYYEACIIFLIFNFLNFPSIITYILFTLFLTKILKERWAFIELKQRRISIFFIPIFILISLISVRFYISEIYVFDKAYGTALKFFPYPETYISMGNREWAKKLEKIESEKYIQSKIYTLKNTFLECSHLVDTYPSVENYFMCWKILENLWKKDIALSYYKLWLAKLPDLWNSDSPYWQNYFVKHTITGNRFFSEKYSDIRRILKVTEIVWK